MRVYVAGPITARKHSRHPFIESLGNVGSGTRASIAILLSGHQPFCPFLDFTFFLQAEAGAVTEEMIKTYSIAWLEVCDAVVVLPGWEESRGTLAEMKRARELNIPIYHSVDAFVAGNGKHGQEA